MVTEISGVVVDPSTNGHGAPLSHALPSLENGWPPRPFQIVSLLKLIGNYAHQCYILSHGFTSFDLQVKRLNPAIAKTVISNNLKEGLPASLKSIRAAAQSIGLGSMVLKGIDRAEKEVTRDGLTYAEAGIIMAELERRISDQLASIRFFKVLDSSIPYYPQKKDEYKKPLLSPLGTKKFAKSIEDAEEAGKCFALGRYTACVFHLMRVMERGVQRLGKKLKVSIPVEEKDWGQIAIHIGSALKHMPNTTPQEKKRHAALARVAAYLDNVREAWRNPTMHPKETYTEEEAQDVFGFVRQFMEHLAKIV